MAVCVRDADKHSRICVRKTQQVIHEEDEVLSPANARLNDEFTDVSRDILQVPRREDRALLLEFTELLLGGLVIVSIIVAAMDSSIETLLRTSLHTHISNEISQH